MKKRFLTVVLCLCMLISCSILLTACGDKDEMSYYEKKVFSFGIQNANLSKGQIVFIGDSITDLFPLDDYFQDVPAATYNRGIGGDTVAGVYQRLKVSLYDIAPKKIVLMIGVNDIDGGRKNSYIINHYREILSSIKQNLPTAEVYVMSDLSQHKQLMTYTNIDISKTIPQIMALNEELKTLVPEFGYTYVDLFSATTDSENHLIESYSDDGIHLNRDGFAVWASVIKPYLV